MNGKKKNRIWVNWLIFLLVVLGIGSFVYFVSRGYGYSTETPKPGYWEGRNVQFTLAADGKIKDFAVQSTHSAPFSCGWGWRGEGATLVNNKFNKGSMEKGSNGVDGYFAVDGMFHGEYTITDCGHWRPSPSDTGSWSAKWISETAPTP